MKPNPTFPVNSAFFKMTYITQNKLSQKDQQNLSRGTMPISLSIGPRFCEIRGGRA